MYKIIIVDDEKIWRGFLELLLATRGHMCAQASYGAEALDILGAALPILHREKCHILVTDLRSSAEYGVAMSTDGSDWYLVNPELVAREFAYKQFSSEEFGNEFQEPGEDHIIIAYIPAGRKQPKEKTTVLAGQQGPLAIASASVSDPALVIFYHA